MVQGRLRQLTFAAATLGLAVVAAASVVVAVRGLGAEGRSRVRSLPPPTVSVPVERGQVRDVVVGQADVRPARVEVVRPPRRPGARPVVTEVRVRPGQAVSEGQVLAAVAGRPVIVLSGDLPAFRSLGPGDRGADVRQLQEALSRLHLYRAAVSGVYDAATAAAVASLYDQRGFPFADRGGQETDQVEAAGVPMGEVVFVRGLPARVLELQAKVGEEAGEVLARLAGGELRLVAVVPAAEAGRLQPGMAAAATFPGGVRLEAKVAAAPAPPQGETADVPLDAQLPPELAGKEGRAEIVVATSPPDALVVPVTAVYLSGQRAWVVVDEQGQRRRVDVELGVVAGGKAEIRPRQALRPGQRVVISERAGLYRRGSQTP